MTQQLVLLGAELAHVHLLSHLRQHPIQGLQVTLITPKPQLIYPPMLAGFVAGQHALADCTIALEPLIQPLAAQGSARWLTARAMHLDATAHMLTLDDGRAVNFDWLSINTEPQPQRDPDPQRDPNPPRDPQLHSEPVEHPEEPLALAVSGAREHGLFVRPIDAFCALWPRVLDLAATRALRMAVISGSAGGLERDSDLAVELALAIRHRLPNAAVTLITGGARLGQGGPPRLQRSLAEALRQRNITVLVDSARQILDGEIVLGSGARLASDVPVIATGGAAPPWLAGSGLALDGEGFIAVDADARSTSHPKVFATGQGAAGSRFASPHSAPSAENFQNAQRVAAQLAARLVAVLTQNAASGGRSRLPEPDPRGIRFIACGDGQAVASWGNFAAQGRWVGWLKQRLERAILASYRA